MSFLDRITSVFRAPSGIEAETASLAPERQSSSPQPLAPERQQLDMLERAFDGGSALGGGLYTSGSVSPRAGSDELVQLYRDAPWLRAVSHKVASGVASVQWKLYARRSVKSLDNPTGPRDYVADSTLSRASFKERQASIRSAVEAGEVEEVSAHPFLGLMDRPNPSMSGFSARLVTQVHLDLLGDAFWIVDVDSNGRPVRLWPIPSHWVQGIPTKEAPWFLVDFPNYRGTVPSENVIWFRDIDPGAPYERGVGLGLALADELVVDENASKMLKGYFENSATPNLLVSLKGAKQEVVDRARLKWEKSLRGFRKAYQTFFTGAEIQVQRLDTSFKEMALVDLRKAQRDVVVQTWGMPPEKLGIIENSNRSTIDAADLIYAQEVLVPRLELMRMELQSRLLWRYDQRLILDYVSPVPVDMARRVQVASLMPSYFRIDEVRALADLPALPNGVGDAFLVDAVGKTYIRNLLSLQADSKPVYGYHLSGGLLTNNEARKGLGFGPASEAWGEERTVGAFNPFFDALGAAPGPSPQGENDDPFAPEAAPSTSTEPRMLSDEQAVQRVRALYERAQRPASTRRTYVSVADMRRMLAAIDVDSMAATLQPQIERLVESFGNETIAALEATKRFDMQDPKIAEHIRELLQDRIGRLINTTTRNEIRASVTSWDGEDDGALHASVRDVFDTARVERSQVIAEVEGQRSKEFATSLAMKQSGIEMSKEWVAVADSRTREAHLAMDGQTVDINAPFRVPSGKWSGAETQNPGYFGIPELDMRCRCQSAPVFIAPGDDVDDAPERARLLAAGILCRAATSDERGDLWRAQDQKLRRFESRLSDAAAAGFDAQQERVLAVLKHVLG